MPFLREHIISSKPKDVYKRQPLDQLFETIVDTDTVTDKKDMEEETKEVIDKTSMMEETLMEPVKKKRKRRTKAQIEADKAKENRKKEESRCV